ncbi:MAG: dockerin type I domain-containing protein, partial [Candidatus Bathyarchaeota archaeon]|nr:dockerin type I domain-containing protein [Candidatus Bathyarchaeota archaeon]
MSKGFAFTLLFLLSAVFLYTAMNEIGPNSLVASTPTISVDPSISSAEVGKTFMIDIRISDVIDLYGWEFRLRWNSSLSDALSVTEGGFLKGGGSTFFVNDINNTLGSMLVDCTLVGNVPGVSGNGILATVEFSVKRQGGCVLDLYDTKLVNSLEEAITHTTVDGDFFALIPSFHDISVTNITLSKTIIASGSILHINVIVENLGGFNETFNLNTYADKDVNVIGDEITIESQTIEDLPALTSKIIILSWNVTGFAKENYTISSKASVVSNEINITNNVYVDSKVLVTILGDVTGDGKVDIYDLYQFARAYDTTPEDPKWNPNCDLNDDERISIRDLFYVA